MLIMKNELVVKDNALINASYNLEVTEQSDFKYLNLD